jgi:NADH-ubiquinone oxidoreductase chain 3
LYSRKIIWLLIGILLLILNIASKKTFSDKEKNRPFECGFDPKRIARIPFSLQFFLIAVIFIIFDVELTLLLPLILNLKITNILIFTLTATIFVLILLLGILHEWKNGALDWVK